MSEFWTAPEELIEAYNLSKVIKISGAINDVKFSYVDVESWLNFANPQPEECFLVVNNQKLNLPQRYYHSALQGGNKVVSRTDKVKLRQRIKTDASLVVKNFESLNPKAFKIVMRIGQALQCVPHANLYLTPANLQTFDRHHDPHDILIVHLSGTKIWNVEDFGSVEMNSGDILFIPKGKLHEAKAVDESIHLSVGLYPLKLIDILSIYPSANQSLPLKGSHQLSHQDIVSKFQALSRELAELTNVEISALIRKVMIDKMKQEWVPSTASTELNKTAKSWAINPGRLHFILSSPGSLVITDESAQIEIEGDVSAVLGLLLKPSALAEWEPFKETFEKLVQRGVITPIDV